MPFIREQILALGCGNASKEALTLALTEFPGSSAVLVTGGAKESMMAHPYTAKVRSVPKCVLPVVSSTTCK